MIFLFLTIILLGLIYLGMKIPYASFEAEEVNLNEVNAFINRHGGNHVSHLTFNKDKHVFWTSKKQAIIPYQKVGNKLVVLGDPIGKEEHIKDAIQEFIEYSHTQQLKPVFYQVTPNFLPAYLESGYQLFKLGEEARVPLSDFSLAGKKGAKLRTRKNKFERNGFEFKVVQPPYTEEFVGQIKRISDSWLDGRKEKGFSVGFFCEQYVSRFPLALLINPEGLPIAFATLACDANSENRTMTIDLMRYVKESPHGTMDMLFISIFNWCKENGYSWSSMGMAPLSNLETDNKSGYLEKIAQLTFHHGNAFYNFKGLFEYKNKFFPLWEPRYLAYPKGSLAIILIQIMYLIHRKNFRSTRVKETTIYRRLRKVG
ncbi:phosphatidylglycerol lysyltransferase domain-containing protein [Peribacillus alkalitolerans]|uniref:phosphatidylglycerol lysyltransferase domain-containing protein n=1 Tax=Peribacillus alkalitolerans TaxID=1550385 RepID=UPI0013D810D6|nr:phosphatidylglycerol lysyltransferase domain-containing protein [Peribacillus alkalitolerans]